MNWRNRLRRYRFGGDLIDLQRFQNPFPAFGIRRYSEQDFCRCLEIYRMNEEGRFPEGGVIFFEKSLTEEDSLYVVVELDGVVIGVGGIVIYEFSDVIQTACLSFGLIDPLFHGKGYGTALLAYRISLLNDAKVEWWVTMTSAGGGTEQFFKKLGFVYVDSFADEDGVELENYRMRVLRGDLRCLRRNLSRFVIDIDMGSEIEIPRNDHREEFERLVAEQDGVRGIRTHTRTPP